MLFLWYVEMKGNLSAFPKLLIQISYYLLIQNLLLCCVFTVEMDQGDDRIELSAYISDS